MHGILPLPLEKSPTHVLSQQLHEVIADIQTRQLRKHDATSQDIVTEAATAYAEALLETLMQPVRQASCHLAQQHRISAIKNCLVA